MLVILPKFASPSVLSGVLNCERIGEVEALGAELQFEPFREREIFEDGQVESPGRRPVVRLQAKVALRKRSRSMKFAVLNQAHGVRPPDGAAFGFVPGPDGASSLRTHPGSRWRGVCRAGRRAA